MNLQNITALVGALLCTLTASAAPPWGASTLNDKVAITPGKTFAVQFQKDGDGLKSPKIVKQLGPKQPGISLDFSAQGRMNILHIKNGFPQMLRLRCLMRRK